MEREVPAPVAPERQDRHRRRRLAATRRRGVAAACRHDRRTAPRPRGRRSLVACPGSAPGVPRRARSTRSRSTGYWSLPRILIRGAGNCIVSCGSRGVLAMPSLVGAYLVIFMQAGFALLTCGLVRKKNAAHLVMLSLSAYVFAFIAYYAVGFAFEFGGSAVNAGPSSLGGTPTLDQFLIGRGHWGFVGSSGFFLNGAADDARSSALADVRSRVHAHRRVHPRRRDLRADHVRRVRSVRAVRRRHPVSGLRVLGVGRRMAVAARLDARGRTRLCGLRRFECRPRRRRVLRHGAGDHPRSASREVRT